MIARLHAMYQQSRKILIFLIVTFLTVNIFGVVGAVMTMTHASWGTLKSCAWQEMYVGLADAIPEEVILSGTYMCSINFAEDTILLGSITWILGTVWELLALCLAVWIAVKHFRELRSHSAGGIIGVMGNCFRVMMKTHMLYFARWVHVVNMTTVSAKGSDIPALLLFLASASFLTCLQHSQQYVNTSLTLVHHFYRNIP